MTVPIFNGRFSIFSSTAGGTADFVSNGLFFDESGDFTVSDARVGDQVYDFLGNLYEIAAINTTVPSFNVDLIDVEGSGIPQNGAGMIFSPTINYDYVIPTRIANGVTEYLKNKVRNRSIEQIDERISPVYIISGQIDGNNPPPVDNGKYYIVTTAISSSSSGSSIYQLKEIYRGERGIWVNVPNEDGTLIVTTESFTGGVDEYNGESAYTWNENNNDWSLIGPLNAIDIFFDNSTTNLTSVNVQNAIEEINSKIDPVTYIVNGEITTQNPGLANEGDIYIVTSGPLSSSSSSGVYLLNQLYQYTNGEWILINNADGSQISVTENLTGGDVTYDDNTIYVFDGTDDTWNLVGPQDAIDVIYDNSESKLTSTNVQDAIDELNTNSQTIHNGAAPVYVVTGEITGSIPDPTLTPGEIFIVTGSLSSSSSSSGYFALKSLYKSDGTQWILIDEFEGAQINVTDALSGGSDTYDADSAYMWDQDGGDWVQFGGGTTGGTVRFTIGDAIITASAGPAGFSFSKAAGVGTLTIPVGVDLYSLRINGTSADIDASNNFTVRTTFAGSEYNNTDADTLFPEMSIVDRTTADFGGPTTGLPYNHNNATGGTSFQYTALGGGSLDTKFISINSFNNWTIICHF